jgi:hypothetical protein
MSRGRGEGQRHQLNMGAQQWCFGCQQMHDVLSFHPCNRGRQSAWCRVYQSGRDTRTRIKRFLFAL